MSTGKRCGKSIQLLNSSLCAVTGENDLICYYEYCILSNGVFFRIEGGHVPFIHKQKRDGLEFVETDMISKQ